MEMENYVIYTTPAIDSTCGDVGDIDMCAGVDSELVCNHISVCAWDKTVPTAEYCSVRCSLVVAASSTSVAVTGLTNGVM